MFLELIPILCISGIKTYFSPWEPNDTEIDILRTNPKRRRVEVKSSIGNSHSLIFDKKLTKHFGVYPGKYVLWLAWSSRVFRPNKMAVGMTTMGVGGEGVTINIQCCPALYAVLLYNIRDVISKKEKKTKPFC